MQHGSCNVGGMTLSEFIKSKGNDQAASLFGVPVRTVMSWRYGARRPRPTKAQEIVQLCDGQVSFGEIYTDKAA